MQIFEGESWFAADKGIGILTLAVEKESSVNDVGPIVVTENRKSLGLEQSVCFFNMIFV
jgi:hypothetical protein